MTVRTKILGSVIILLLSFAFGRYSVSAQHTIVSSQQTADIQVKENKDTHTQTTITETKKSDGTTTITTHIDNQVTDKKDATKQVETQTKTESIPEKTNTLNLSLMGGYNLVQARPIYGALVTKQLVGPVTMGLFGLTNGIIGATIGLNF